MDWRRLFAKRRTLDVEIPFSADIADKLEQGKMAVSFREGPITQPAPGKFQREVLMCLDGQPYGLLEVTWTGDEHSPWSIQSARRVTTNKARRWIRRSRCMIILNAIFMAVNLANAVNMI